MSIALFETARIGDYDGAAVAYLGNPGKYPEIAALSDVIVLDLDTGRAPTDLLGKRRSIISVSPDKIEVYAPFNGDATLTTETFYGRYAVVAQPLEV